jgi:uncharacterized protein (TIGR03085 family)
VTATATLLKERAALCDTLERVGPEAPTLCEGWQAIDLAAHLVAREARADAALGLVLPGPFARHMRHVMEGYKEKGYTTLVEMLRTGPPLMHRTGPLAAANVNENFVHHEDVRRANGEARRADLDPEIDVILWRMLGFGARLARRKLHGAALTLRTPDGREREVSRDGPRVTLIGEPSELALFLAGRKEAAEVTYEGDATAYAIVLAADLGV